MYENFFRYLKESRVYATRHISIEEKEAVIQCLKLAIKSNNIELVNRDKNNIFKSKYNLTNEFIFNFLYSYVKPKDIICALRDRKDHDKELYLCSTKVPNSKNFFIYIKFYISKNGFVDVISFHDCKEKKYVDYSKVSDYEDNSFVEKVANKIKYNYFKFKNKNHNNLLWSYIEKNLIIFEFEDEIDENTKAGIFKSMPNDMGLNKYEMIKEYKEDYKKIILKVITRSFEKF